MNNKKEKKAINILRDQKDKLADINYTPNQVWITETQSYVKDFFGENSREFKFIDEFRFTYIDIPHNIFLANKEKAKEYLSNCIDRIKHYGLYKPPKQNFIARMDQKALIAWLSVSRMEEYNFFQCFIRDEGRPFIYVLREEYINHFMVL